MTGIAVGLGVLAGVAFGWWLAVAIAAGAAVIAACSRGEQRWLVALVIVTATAAGAWRASMPGSDRPGGIPDLTLPALVVAAPKQFGQGQSFIVDAAREQGGGVSRICVTSGPLPAVALGDRLELRASVSAASDAPAAVRSALLMRDCEWRAYAASVAIVGAVPSVRRWLAGWRAEIGGALRRAAPGDAGVLLSGLVTGDDEGFSRERETAFQRTNTTHLTAVSGSNLAMVAGMMATLGAATIGRYRGIWQVLTILAVWSYTAVSGAQPPAIRAAVVVTAAVLAFRFGRRADFPTLIVLAAAAMVLIDPRHIDRLGFRLSVAASLALAIVFGRLLADGRGSIGVDLVAATMAAQLATLPLMLPVFGTVSLISLPANVIVAPLAALAMPIAAVAGLAGVFWTPLGEVLAAPAAMVAAAILFVVDRLATAPGLVSVGTPPPSATLVIAVAVLVILMTISGDTGRQWWRLRTSSAVANIGIGRRGEGLADGSPTSEALPLPAAALAVVRGEDPLDPLCADPHHPEQEPSSQEQGHELADEGKRGQPILRDVGRHAPVELTGDESDDHADQHQRANEHLSSPADKRDVFAAQEVDPLQPGGFGTR